MSHFEIPLLRESESFARRLISAAEQFDEPVYFFRRRVNWSHRRGDDFYAQEVSCYMSDPEGYIAGDFSLEPLLSDVYLKKVSGKQAGVVMMKVISHWAFSAVGKMLDPRIKARGTNIYRKCYVDDIELVFDETEVDVIRAIFPFPLNVWRQFRYIAHLYRKRMFFKLDGNPYVFSDVLRFMIRRDVRSLMRLESRAQIRLARSVIGLGVSSVQLSDEFEMGSLDFTRCLARYQVRVVNSAHGVGKYLPFHCYRDFYILTDRQRHYYRAVRPCNYVMRRLNDKSTKRRVPTKDSTAAVDRGIRLVCLGQTSGASGSVIAENESTLLDALREAFLGDDSVQLLYKPHPNKEKVETIAGFTRLCDLNEVNGLDGTIFVSFFSTCQIDPAFKGTKILVKGKYIHPEIAFDESEPIMTSAELIDYVKSCVARPSARETTSPS